MKNRSIVLAALIVVGIMGLLSLVVIRDPVRAIGVTTYFDSCRNVKFRVTNQRGIAIRLKKVKYYNADEKKWRTEDIQASDANFNCESGAVCYLEAGEDLQDAEGDHLSKIIFEYQEINNSTMRDSPTFVPTSSVCKAEKQYGNGQGWTISGSSPAPPSSGSESDSLSDACKNVSFVVSSGLSVWIKIDKVKYYNSASGKWKTEDVEDEECAPLYPLVDNKCTVGGRDNLADANNDDLTKIVFVYAKEKKDYSWEGAYESQEFKPETPKCREQKIYGNGQGWTIK